MATQRPRRRPDWSLRAARPEDEDFLFRVFAYSRDMAGLPLPPDQREALLRMQYRSQDAAYRFESPELQVEVIECGGEAAGRLITARQPRSLWIVDLVVLPRPRAVGAGAAVLRALMAEAAATGCVLRGSVAPHNPARRLYRRLGIVERPADGSAMIALEWRPAGAG